MFPTRKLTESLTRLGKKTFFKLNYSVCFSLSDFLLCNFYDTTIDAGRTYRFNVKDSEQLRTKQIQLHGNPFNNKDNQS